MEPRWITAICWSLLAAACTVQYTERDDANSYGCEATDSCWWQDSGDDDGVTPGDDSDDVEFCRDDGDCSAGRVCVGWGDCVDIVEDCPLTEECLADPPATEAPPEWLGIDPAFSGVLGDGDDPRRISVELDFYPDHLYGEGTIFDLLADTASDVIITGTRSGASLEGQIVAIGGGRSFDATFAGRLLSASRISGTFTWSDDHGVREGTLEWYRTSPCGCLAGVCETDRDCGDGEHCTNERCQPDPECDDDRDCADGEACEAGSCAAVPGCERDRDCADGEICEAGTCEAMPECEATDDCVATDCYFDSDCGEGMICEAGSCEAAPPCLNDADCGEGMVCEAGSCEAAPPCFDDSDCGEGMICEAGSCVAAPPCVADGDCGAGMVCEAGSCRAAVPPCVRDSDCGMGSICEDCVCVPAPCAIDADCDAGLVCVAGACVEPECTSTCQCESGEVCADGRCVPRESPILPCGDDCDCDYEGGEHCVAGYCE